MDFIIWSEKKNLKTDENISDNSSYPNLVCRDNVSKPNGTVWVLIMKEGNADLVSVNAWRVPTTKLHHATK